MTLRTVHSNEAPEAVGPYSQGVWAGEILYLSGQAPLDPATGKLIEGHVGEQAKRVFDNLEAVLTSAGLAMNHVVKCNVYLVSMDDFQAMNEVYAQRFTAPFPARSTVGVAELPLGARVEIEMIARRPEQ
ncbi:Enamine/imine deaminase [Posidoniimonas polymericola]|uniref:Enamine/imine deaminase n=1 Tax=Posidoniimonas polymericola TaxID=2528002 RepID=A0A5C5XRW9_9BACT|nr:RidA family protein [Posidoniimonas polymericola]TWT65947.1 Enamine/imine deaminase [Posidoniimonas polymericola]